MRDLHKQVTDSIIAQLEAGTAPWRKPWQGGSSVPFTCPVNATTGKKYRGINIPLLWGSTDAQGFVTHEWATFKQWQAADEMVKKGEKGTLIVFWSTFEKETENGTEEIPFLKSSVVFNRCQLKSFDAAAFVPAEKPNPVQAVALADEFIINTQAAINHNGNGRAFYRPSTDEIYMPVKESFIGTDTQTPTEAYYATLLHELSHWTGHKDRCDRQMGKRFGDNAYAMEELIAEMSAAFLCAELGIADAPRADHANYLADWLKVLKEDKKALLTAASQASKANDFLIALQTAKMQPVEAKPVAEVVELPKPLPVVVQQAVRPIYQQASLF